MSSSQLVEGFEDHDFQLRGYTVRDYGRSIVLDLIRGGEPERVTWLEFSGVESYRFLHTGGASITDILEVPFMEAIRETGADFPEEFRQQGGLSVHFESNEDYARYYEKEGFHTWLIHSAIGFIGMVVGRCLTSVQAEPSAGGECSSDSDNP